MDVAEKVAGGLDKLLGRKDAEIRKYMREVRRNLDDMKGRDRKQILNEIRAHIDEKFTDAIKENPGKDRALLAREVLDEFGEPSEIAKAYMPEGFVPQRGHTTVRVAKILAAAFAAMFISAIVVDGIVLCINAPYVAKIGTAYYQNAQQNQRKYTEYTEYEYRNVYNHMEQIYPAPRTSVLPVKENFYLPDYVTKIELQYVVQGYQWNIPGVSNVRIQVTNPEGNVVFDWSFSGYGTETGSSNFEPMEGDWNVSYTYTSYSGFVRVSGSVTIEHTYYY